MHSFEGKSNANISDSSILGTLDSESTNISQSLSNQFNEFQSLLYNFNTNINHGYSPYKSNNNNTITKQYNNKSIHYHPYNSNEGQTNDSKRIQLLIETNNEIKKNKERLHYLTKSIHNDNTFALNNIDNYKRYNHDNRLKLLITSISRRSNIKTINNTTKKDNNNKDSQNVFNEKIIPTIINYVPKSNQESKKRIIERWYIGETLGKGGYSWVKKGIDIYNGKIVALKFINKSISQTQIDAVKTEIEILKTIQYVFI